MNNTKYVVFVFYRDLGGKNLWGNLKSVRPRNKIDKENDSLEQLPKKRKCQCLHNSPSPNDDNELSYEDAYSTLQD